jgi:hypothetical protein
MMNKGKIQLVDKLAKPGFSPIGGELFAKITRADGSEFLQQLEHQTFSMLLPTRLEH